MFILFVVLIVGLFVVGKFIMLILEKMLKFGDMVLLQFDVNQDNICNSIMIGIGCLSYSGVYILMIVVVKRLVEIVGINDRFF